MIAESEWIHTTVGKAKKLLNKGYIVWFRPYISTYSQDPDNDVAWVLEVK